MCLGLGCEFIKIFSGRIRKGRKVKKKEKDGEKERKRESGRERGREREREIREKKEIPQKIEKNYAENRN